MSTYVLVRATTPTTTRKGLVQMSDNGDLLKVTFKKPRSKKYQQEVIPIKKVLAFEVGEGGFVCYESIASTAMTVKKPMRVETSITGFLTVTLEEGQTIEIRDTAISMEFEELEDGIFQDSEEEIETEEDDLGFDPEEDDLGSTTNIRLVAKTEDDDEEF